MSYLTLKMVFLSLVLVYFQPGFADEGPIPGITEVREIQQQWDKLYYMDEFRNNNYKELQALARRANRLSHSNPKSAEALVWDAIVLSTLAEKKGGIGALSLVKEAKLKLEQAEKIDGDVLGGSVYASLATLYSKVPGWPIGFGNDKKAKQYFDKALHVNPQGLDARSRAKADRRFYRARQSPGDVAGLGLSIVKTITEAHSATMQLGESELGGLSVKILFA